MIATGMIRKIDNLGRIVIPKEIRKNLNIRENDAIEMFTDENRLVLRKYAPFCIFCNSDRGIIAYKGHNVCQKCVEGLSGGQK